MAPLLVAPDPDPSQYIGQLELLAAIMMYYSVPELRDSSPIHWIDNTNLLSRPRQNGSLWVTLRRLV